MPNEKGGYEPSPSEIREAEERMDDTSIESNPDIDGKSLQRRETEVREDAYHEGKKRGVEEATYSFEEKRALVRLGVIEKAAYEVSMPGLETILSSHSAIDAIRNAPIEDARHALWLVSQNQTLNHSSGVNTERAMQALRDLRGIFESRR